MSRKRISYGFKNEIFIDIPERLSKWQSQQPLYKRLYLTGIGFFPNAKFHHCQRPSGCDSAIMIYCIAGQGFLEYNGKTITVNENQLILIPSNTPHTYYASLANPWSIYWSQFSGDDSEAYIDLLQNEIMPISIRKEHQTNIIDYYNKMIDLLSIGFSKDHMLYCTNLHKSLLSLINHKSMSHSRESSKYIDYIGLSIEYMKKKITLSLTIEELSDHVGLSRSYYQHIFKEKTGMSPIHYLTSLKMQKACEILATTNIPIKNIAASVGYDDPYYFSRIFKRTIGVSPSEYRLKTVH